MSKQFRHKIGNMFFNINAMNEDCTELYIYSEISPEKSYDWWTGQYGEEVTPADFLQQLKDATQNSKEIVVRINSNGGEIFAARTIATHLQECNSRGAKTICKIDGVCASAAVLPALACQKIMIPSGGYIYIHNPLKGMNGYFDSEDLRKSADTLDSLKQGIINSYIERTGLSEKELSKMMDDEAWLTGKEAVEKGFADEIMFDVSNEQVINSIKGVFVNTVIKVPEALRSVLDNKLTENEGGNKTMEFKNCAELKAAFPDFINQIENAAKEEGAKAERARLQSIDKMQGKVSDEVLNKAKYETFEAAEKVALDAVSNGSFVNTTVLNGMMADAQTANNVNGFANNGLTQPEMTEVQKQAKFAAESATKYLNSIGKGGAK